MTLMTLETLLEERFSPLKIKKKFLLVPISEEQTEFSEFFLAIVISAFLFHQPELGLKFTSYMLSTQWTSAHKEVTHASKQNPFPLFSISFQMSWKVSLFN